MEEGIKNGGAAMITANMLRERGINCKFDIVAIDDSFACPDSLCDIYDHIQMSPSLLVEKFLD